MAKREKRERLGGADMQTLSAPHILELTVQIRRSTQALWMRNCKHAAPEPRQSRSAERCLARSAGSECGLRLPSLWWYGVKLEERMMRGAELTKDSMFAVASPAESEADFEGKLQLLQDLLFWFDAGWLGQLNNPPLSRPGL